MNSNSTPTWDDVICNGNNYIIPEGIKEIPEYAFRDKNIKSIAFPKSLKKISQYAFYDAKGEYLTIPRTVTKIEENAFSKADFREIILECRIKYISPGMFYDSKIEKVIIPEGVTKIYSEAFKSCWNLKEVVLPNSLESIDWHAFSDCYRLENVLGKSLEGVRIKGCAFDFCDKLANEDGLIILNDTLFLGKKMETDRHIVIPEGVTSLSWGCLDPQPYMARKKENGDSILDFCKEITFPKSITFIDGEQISKRTRQINVYEGTEIKHKGELYEHRTRINYYK